MAQTMAQTTPNPACRVVLLAHAPLASAWGACAAHILGHTPEQLACMDIAPDGDVEATAQQIFQRLACPLTADNTDNTGTLILCDVMGATPFNIAHRVMQQLQARQQTNPQTNQQTVALLAGANLCMVLKALTLNANGAGDVNDLAVQVLQSAHKSMVQVSPASASAACC